MLKLICLCFLVLAVRGHNNALQNEADLQSSLMPQELNPEIVMKKDQPWKAVMPVVIRQRRNSEPPAVAEDSPTAPEATPVTVAITVKRYSRMIACVVLALSSVVEIVLFVLDFYLA